MSKRRHAATLHETNVRIKSTTGRLIHLFFLFPGGIGANKLSDSEWEVLTHNTLHWRSGELPPVAQWLTRCKPDRLQTACYCAVSIKGTWH
jgi:hypothetical protein